MAVAVWRQSIIRIDKHKIGVIDLQGSVLEPLLTGNAPDIEGPAGGDRVAGKYRIDQQTGLFQRYDRPLPLRHNLTKRIKKVGIEVTPFFGAGQVGDVLAIGIMSLVREQPPCDPEFEIRRQRSQERQFHEIADVSGITILHVYFA